MYSDFSCILACTMNSSTEILYLIFTEQVSQNNVLIGQFVTPWVSVLAQLSIYTDIFHRLASGTDFGQKTIFSSIRLVIPQVSKYTLVLALLYSQLQPVIRGLFRRFGYRLTSIFSGKFSKNTINVIGDTYTPYF